MGVLVRKKNILCKKRFSFVENLSNQPCTYWKQSCHNQKYPDDVYTKQSSEKLWCDLLHDPEIGSHIVLQRDTKNLIKFRLRHNTDTQIIFLDQPLSVNIDKKHHLVYFLNSRHIDF